jgi:uncharacterized protein (TIGR03905 family)
MYEYKTQGTCSSRIRFDIKDGNIHSVDFEGGCNGNLGGITKLVEGMDAKKLIAMLKNTPCGGRGTSCPDQLARAVEAALTMKPAS